MNKLGRERQSDLGMSTQLSSESHQILNDFKSAVVSTLIRPLASIFQGQDVPSPGGADIFNQCSNFRKGSFAPLVEM